jgi:uncharacterized protein YidB (DUF937 family)
MGLLDEVLAATGLGASVQAQQHAGALSAILNYVNSPQVGGISCLQKTFQEKGLGGIVNSWISTGQNLPVSADQLQNVLHSGALQQAAQSAGIDPSQLVSMMTTFLPHIVDKLTPNGAVPDNSAFSR